MTDSKANSAAQAENPQDVDRIRDIIFGSQIRDYENRFDNLQRDLDRLQQSLDRMAEQATDQDANQSKKLQDLRKEMRESNDGLRDELRQTAQRLTDEKVDRLALGDLFVELGTQLKSGGSLADLLKGLGESAK